MQACKSTIYKIAEIYAFIACLIIGVGMSINMQAFAQENISLSSAKEKITQYHGTFENLINNPETRQDFIIHLHNHIHHDAVFNNAVTSADNPMHLASSPQTLDKADYINSYIEGTNYIQDYALNIELVSISYGQSGTIKAEEIFYESGQTLNPLEMDKEGQNFISTTRCTSLYHIENDQPMKTGATCHTQIHYQDVI